MRASQGSIKFIIKADDSTTEVLVNKYACHVFIGAIFLSLILNLSWQLQMYNFMGYGMII